MTDPLTRSATIVRIRMIWAISAVLFFTLFSRGLELDLAGRTTGRVVYHAIPMALSVMYHGHAHDYTALRAVALQFQNESVSQEQRLKTVLAFPRVEDRSVYFWAADDRGMGDFVIGAFTLFGPSLDSLYYMYFCVLALSALCYAYGFRDRLDLSLVLPLFLLALLATLPVIPLADEATMIQGVSSVERISSVQLAEPRLFDLLSMLAILHLAMFALRGARPTASDLSILAVQVAIFTFCYHARSSLGWQLAALTAIVTAIALYRWRAVPASGRGAARAGWISAAAPLLLVGIGLGALSAYKHAAYHPRYFADMGARTFWHNALMGFEYEPVLARHYGLAINDQVTANAVIRFANERKLLAPGETWDAQVIMNSLGGHAEFDWKRYERFARKFYWQIVVTHPERVALLYLFRKPVAEARIAINAWQNHSDKPAIRAVRREFALFFSPLSWVTLAWLGLLALLAHRVRATLPAVGGIFAMLLVASLIPGIAFYSAVLTMSGVFLMTAMIAATGALWLACTFTARSGLAARSDRVVDRCLLPVRMSDD